MSIAGANKYLESASAGKTTVNHTDSDTDTDPGSVPAPADHVHVDFDIAHKACLAEIATLFENIQVDLRIITDRGDDRAKGMYQREADTVANNPANIAAAAKAYVDLEQSAILGMVNAEVGNPTNLGNTTPANYNAIRNNTTLPGGFSGGGPANRQSAGYGGNAGAFVGEDGNTYEELNLPLSQIVTAAGSAAGVVSYAIAGKQRNLTLQSELYNILESAAATAKVDVLITSGGQVPVSEGGIKGVNRIGSNRHDKGYAADVQVFTGQGLDKKQLKVTNTADLPIMLKFCQAAEAAGATSIGIGNGYMKNTGIHIDIAWKGQQAGVISGISPWRYWSGTKASRFTATTYIKDLMTTEANV